MREGGLLVLTRAWVVLTSEESRASWRTNLRSFGAAANWDRQSTTPQQLSDGRDDLQVDDNNFELSEYKEEEEDDDDDFEEGE